MQRSLLRWGIIRRTLTRSIVTHGRQTVKHSAEVQRTLAAYPLFHLNDDGSNQHLGPRRGDEVILTLSGGVDSSVSAYLALQEGGLIPHRTIFMRNWNSLEESETFEPGSGGSQGCQWQRDWEKVLAMAKWLGVKAELMDLSTPYWNTVFSPSLDEWSRGWTPNPDVMCNREIKFGELLRRVDQEANSSFSQSAAFGRSQTKRWLVTGHYAGLQYYSPVYQPESTHGRLLRAADQTKDQSYFLSAVSSETLGRTHFPLSRMSKVQVRQLARSLGMPTAESEESMGICFVGERRAGAIQKQETGNFGNKTEAGAAGFAQFLGGYIESRMGDIVTLEGQVVGKHRGLHTVTIGQGARISGAKEKFFVAAKRTELNQLVVVPGSNHPWLQCHSLSVSSFTFTDKDDAEKALQNGRIFAQVRHRQNAVPCTAFLVGASTVEVHFDPPILSIAEGQVCALYHDQQCLGSGVITKVETQGTTSQGQKDTPSLE